MPIKSVEERSSLGHCRDLPNFKPPPTLARFGRSDGRIARSTRQYICWSTRRRTERFSISTTGVYCQGQCDVDP